jgi:AcrR family transcriptional regulator
MDKFTPLSYTGRMSAIEERPLRKDAERNRRRILDAAAELFSERGLSVTLNDIAHHADVGVGTVYRRFPNKELLIDALFEERFAEFVTIAEEGLADPDPWRGLVSFLERGLQAQARDRGLKQLLIGTPEGCGRIGQARERVLPLAAELITRARDAGELRPDIEPEDLPVIQWMLGAALDHGRDVKPELWRRYFALILRGMRAEPQAAEPLPVGPLSVPEIDAAIGSASRAAAERPQPR